MNRLSFPRFLSAPHTAAPYYAYSAEYQNAEHRNSVTGSYGIITFFGHGDGQVTVET